MIGVVNSAFGLSAFFFSLIARRLFPGETEAFLTLLVFGTSIPVFAGATVIRPKVEDLAAVEVEHEEGQEAELDEDEQTPLRSAEQGTAYGGIDTETSDHTALEITAHKDPAEGVEDVHGLDMVKTSDFWIIFGIVAMCESISLGFMDSATNLIEKWAGRA